MIKIPSGFLGSWVTLGFFGFLVFINNGKLKTLLETSTSILNPHIWKLFGKCYHLYDIKDGHIIERDL